jgi:putative transposase
VELANRESATSWRNFLGQLQERGLCGGELAISDDHPGLRQVIFELLPQAVWQRCYVHFLRNAVDDLPRKRGDCRTELGWVSDRRDLEKARRDLAAWPGKWQGRYPKPCDWVEDRIEQTCSFYRLPRQHHRHVKPTNMLERFNQEIKRRTHIARTFPNGASCPRLVRALAVEIHEE